jgi:hypothetical protein
MLGVVFGPNGKQNENGENYTVSFVITSLYQIHLLKRENTGVGFSVRAGSTRDMKSAHNILVSKTV